jgi:hypothetical protein
MTNSNGDGKKKYIVGIFILFVAFIVISTQYDYFTEKREKAIAKEIADEKFKEEERLAEQKREEEEKLLEMKRNTFLLTIDNHYGNILEKYENGSFEAVLEKYEEFKEHGQEEYKALVSIIRSTKEKMKNIRIAELEEIVRKIPASKYKENLDIYTELRNLDPDNESYRSKFKHYWDKVAEENAKKTAERRRQEAIANSDLELVRWSWSKDYSYVIAEGQVKNISQRRLERVEALVTWYDANKNFITSQSSLIEFNPIMPNQTSPFKVTARHNPAMKSASIEFKFLFGEKIRTYNRD